MSEALLLMREGDEWLVTMPSELGYGDVQRGALLPPGSLLRYRIQLEQVRRLPRLLIAPQAASSISDSIRSSSDTSSLARIVAVIQVH